jgi:hypothetical protein
MCNHLMYYCEKCGYFIDGYINTYCDDYNNQNRCSDLTVDNSFRWLCLPCLKIYFASWPSEKLSDVKS